MPKQTTMTTGRASLCALGEYLRRHCFFAPLREHVQIRQKTVRYRMQSSWSSRPLSRGAGAGEAPSVHAKVEGFGLVDGSAGWGDGRLAPDASVVL